MFINPSYEDGHWHPNSEYIIAGWHFPILDDNSDSPPVSELQLPNDWTFRWADHTIENPHSSDTWNQFVRPEVRVLNENDLPEDEREQFIVHGSHTLKIFKGYGAWYGALYQKFELEDALYQVSVNIFNDAVKKYVDGQKIPDINPNACQVRIIVDGLASEWRPLHPQHMNNETFVFRAGGSDNSEEIAVQIEIMMPYALDNSGIFADLWNMVEIHKIEEECTHVGLPRVQYARTYVLLPSGYDASWATAVVDGSWDRWRYTVGGSADDAGIGDLVDKTAIIVNPHEWANSIREFFAEYYPHTEIKTITAATQDELTQKLRDQDFDEEPPPPNGNGDYGGPVYPKLTRGHWGLHIQVMQDGVWEYVADTTPGIMKFFGLTDVEKSVNLEPRTPVIYRHYTADQNIPDTEDAIRQAAIDYIALFKDDTHRHAESLAVDHNFRPLFYIESYNEMYPSLNRVVVRKAALFDQMFAEEMRKEFGGYVGAALFCAAVGNPHESEYNELLRVAEAAVKYNGLLGYHSYWWANNTGDNGSNSGLLSWWKFHAGRWQDIDDYLRSFELYPRWYSGESGVVYSSDGYALNPGAGWRHSSVYNGNLDSIMDDIMIVDALDADWNAVYGNRYLGNTFFTTGTSWTGWEWFQWQRSQMERLSEEINKTYPRIEARAATRAETIQAAIIGRDSVRSMSRLFRRARYKVHRRGRMLRKQVKR